MDKKPITNTNDLTGKTIRAAKLGCGKFVMAFTDGTFTALVAEEGSFHDDPADLEFDRYPDAYHLQAVGVISLEEYHAIREEQQEAVEKAEKNEYERLRAKFEGEAGG